MKSGTRTPLPQTLSLFSSLNWVFNQYIPRRGSLPVWRTARILKHCSETVDLVLGRILVGDGRLQPYIYAVEKLPSIQPHERHPGKVDWVVSIYLLQLHNVTVDPGSSWMSSAAEKCNAGVGKILETWGRPVAATSAI